MPVTHSTDLETPDYDRRVRLERGWAMDEGDRHFRREGEVFKALRGVAGRLDELGIPYAIVGGMALDAHGYRRLTVDVDLLVTRDGLATIHARLDGLGYVPPFPGSRNLRDTETGVRVEFLVAGDFPGDGKPKPVAFPDPAEAATRIDGLSYIQLPRLVELKLASGMTGGVARMRDLTDVIALIEAVPLDLGFADDLNPYVRPKYRELWEGLRQSPPGPGHA